MKTCLTDGCDNITEGRTDFCAHHNRLKRKVAKQRVLEAEKKQQPTKLYPRERVNISKVGTKNTWLCSSGRRVTQAEINRFRDGAYNYQAQSKDITVCEGCGKPATCRAHIIGQARSKQIGKTELIWHLGNFFPSCFDCNSAIENPKAVAWHGLKNIGECLAFMERHDPELFMKFSVNGILEI